VLRCVGVCRISLVLLIGLPALLLGCGSSGKGEAPVPQADFSLQVAPGSVTIPAGGSAFVTLTLSRLNGFTAPVNLTFAGLPPGVVAEGTIPAGSSTLQVPILVGVEVAPAAYPSLSVQGQVGALVHSTGLALTVQAPLPASHLRVDLVQAAGGRQTGGVMENHPVVRGEVAAATSTDAGNSILLRHGFDPAGKPSDH